MKHLLFFATTLLFISKAQSQNVGIGTATPTTILEVVSTTKGVLIPRLTTAQMNAILTPANGLIITNTDSTNRLFIYTGTAWRGLGFTGEGGTAIDTSLLVHKAGTETIVGQKIFTQDILVNGMIIGKGSGGDSTNTVVGNKAFLSNFYGQYNTVLGDNSLFSNFNGTGNTSIGNTALFSNTSGGINTAEGYQALYSNTTGDFNTATGAFALYYNTTGRSNIAYGYGAANYLGDGFTSLELANNSLFLGANTMAQANDQTNQIVIGNDAIGDGDNSTVIGNSSIISTKLQGQLKLPIYGSGNVTGVATFNLATDLSGNIIEVPSGSGSQWVTTGNDIYYTNGNVGIGTNAPVSSALLALSSTTKGLLIPRMSTSEMNAIVNPAIGLKINNTTDSSEYLYRGTTSGWQNVTVESKGSKAYTGAISWLAGTAPSGAIVSTYSWNKIGNLVTLRMNISYAVAGNAVTSLSVNLPSDMPIPFQPTGFTGNNMALYTGQGALTVANTHLAAMTNPFSILVNDGGIYKIRLTRAPAAVRFAYINIQYFTN